MLNQGKHSQSWQKTLNLITQCPVCNHVYEKQTARFFINDKNAHLVHTTCSNCHGYFLTLIIELGRALSTVGMITDLSFADVKRLYIKNDISLDEAIASCELVESKKFVKLLSKNNK